jgi:hypothetical protein
MAYQIKLRVIAIAVIQFFLITSILHAQVEKKDDTRIKDRSEDIFREMNSGDLTLRFINALNGEYVPGASVFIGSKEYMSDYEGRVFFKPPVENGPVTVDFESEDYISARFEIELMNGTIYQNRISVSPSLQPGSIRVVLDWSDSPRDLDAHLIKDGGYHISYRNRKSSDDGKAKLDRDDRNGNGPETITVKEVDDVDIYTYKVYNYSDRNDDESRSLSNNSNATVRIYGDNQLLGTFRTDRNVIGTEWTVFQIIDGRIISVNSVD